MRGVVVGAGVCGEGGDDSGRAGGDGCPDGGLPFGLAVEDLDVERGVELGFDVVGGVTERGGGVGQFVDERDVLGGGLGGVDVV
jgi:hypothetical protein